MGEVIKQPGKRMVEQDIAKGFAILLVIFVHSAQLDTQSNTWMIAFTGYIMPFFFFISGYNYRPGRGTWGKNVAKRARQLLLPLLFYSLAIYVVMFIYFTIRHETTFLDTIKSFGAFWLTRPLSTWLKAAPDPNPSAGLLVQGWFLQFMMTG